MIEKDGNKFALSCDLCLFTVECDTFKECVQYKKDNGWCSRKDKQGDWTDVCDECRD